MAVQLLNPTGQSVDPLYHQVSVASGTRYIHLAGQVARNEHAELVAAGDLAGQVVQVLRNVNKGLEAEATAIAD
jgi:enamine deaminase RidA (YjgF/YER057c/UK114 family)